jgi:hypothetical protein
MITRFSLAAAILLTVQPAFAETGTDLLDKLITAPGSYSQVCISSSISEGIPIEAFRIQDNSGTNFSDSNIELMEAHREELIPAIRLRLGAIDLSKEPKSPKSDPNASKNERMMSDCYGADPYSLNSFLLEIVKRTKAIEVLLELMTLEANLSKSIVNAERGGSLPEVSGYYMLVDGDGYNDNEPPAAIERRRDLNRSRIVQRDLVMLIAILLREQKFEPYLATDFEKAYVEGLREQAHERGLDAPEKKDDSHIKIDPISGIRHYDYHNVEIPYSRQLRVGVRRAARKWISENTEDR